VRAALFVPFVIPSEARDPFHRQVADEVARR